MEKSRYTYIKIAVVITYLVMVIVNGLANALPINEVTTGQVSDSYFDLFAPTGLTFSIWGLIYILLAGYTLYQLGFLQEDKGAARMELFQNIGILFAISSIANAAWIFAWHYDAIGLSLLLMIVILVCLTLIAEKLRKEEFDLKEKIFIRLPFSIYFGWITVATIANVTTYLVSTNWGGFGIPEQVWTVVILIIGTAIGIARMLRDKNIAYGLVIIWAYTGIWIKHASPAEFAGQYPAIISTVAICIFLLVVVEAFQMFTGYRKKAA